MADQGLVGLFGAYGSDDEGASGGEETQPQGEPELAGSGVVLVGYAGPADEPPTPSAAAAVGALLAARNSAPLVDAPLDVSMEGQPGLPAEAQAQEADPALQLPPELEKPPDKPVKAGLQDKVARFLERKAARFSISEAYRRHRDYSNPQFLEKMIEHFGVDQYGTSFAPQVFDPKSLPREDHYDELAAQQNRLSAGEARQPGQAMQFTSAKASKPSPPAATTAAAIVASARAAAQDSKRKWDATR